MRIDRTLRALSPLNDGDELGPFTVGLVRRALSVEATGTENGGGHE
jgi:hypothetical protein